MCWHAVGDKIVVGGGCLFRIVLDVGGVEIIMFVILVFGYYKYVCIKYWYIGIITRADYFPY